MKKVIITMILLLVFSPLVFGAKLYWSDFESDTIGDPPQGWELGFDGSTEGTVIEDPINPGNKVFSHSDLTDDQSRHDVGGSIWVVGEENWTDYMVEYDAYFPTDFYIGTLFRFQDDDAFYLFDRRQGGPTFDFWKQEAGAWTNIAAGAAFDAQPENWYRFRIVIEGDTFEAYAKEQVDDTPFEDMQPIQIGTDATFANGKFGLYGLIYIDNIVIGETEADMTLAVDSTGKLNSTWGAIKAD
ncbi:hypothetical protein GF312_09695 [Candidatus Poribacteria bacterium]|nr:hypothetical protein [Candidatus Poribacteria bacterium]